MTREEGEDDLRAQFAHVRDEDRRGMPRFAETLGRFPSKSHGSSSFLDARHWWLPAAALASAVLVLVTIIARESREIDLNGLAWESVQWEMPTDVLLDLSALPAAALMGDFQLRPNDIEPMRDDASRPTEIHDRPQNGGLRHVRSLG